MVFTNCSFWRVLRQLSSFCYRSHSHAVSTLSSQLKGSSVVISLLIAAISPSLVAETSDAYVVSSLERVIDFGMPRADSTVTLGLVIADLDSQRFDSDANCSDRWFESGEQFVREQIDISYTAWFEGCDLVSAQSIANTEYFADSSIVAFIENPLRQHQNYFSVLSSLQNSHWLDDDLYSKSANLRSAEVEYEVNRHVFNVDPQDYRDALKILKKKWQPHRNDPGSLSDDIDKLAQYIGGQPEALALLKSLAKKPIFLHYQRGQFRSNVKGTPFAVRSVRIYFDPRSAAKLVSTPMCETDPAYCAVAPADALIHELLHAQIALLHTDEFIASGGMSQLVYPHAHEQQVIRRERDMYRAMTHNDTRPRPLRRNHVGALYATSCVTCIEG